MTTAPLPFPQSSTAQVGPVVPLPVGVRIDRFVVEKTLHEGPHGFAYRVRESGHHVPLVLLECFPRALAIRQPDGAVRARQAGDAIALSVVAEAFLQDARALAALNHPGVVKVFGTLNANRTVYRLMPYLEGQTLEEQRLERPEPPTLGGLMRLYDKLLDALEAVHAAGFVHGYVQPDQILMRTDDNAPVLLGMDGVAMELGEITMSPWAAPEQQQSTRYERVNTSADMYMLAATMYFAATGAAPPRAQERLTGDGWDAAVLLAEVPLGGGDAPALLDNFIQAVGASLALAPAARPQRADDVRHILHPRGDGGFVSTSGPVPLWVGEMPDRDSQWETLEGMSGPVPLTGQSGPTPLSEDMPPPDDTPPRPPRAPVEPKPLRETTAPRPAGGPVEPTLAPVPVRHPPVVEPVLGAGRRASDATTRRPRVGMIAGGGALLIVLTAGLAWYSQRPQWVPMLPSPGAVTVAQPAPPPPATAPARAPAPTPAVRTPPPAPAPMPPAPTATVLPAEAPRVVPPAPAPRPAPPATDATAAAPAVDAAPPAAAAPTPAATPAPAPAVPAADTTPPSTATAPAPERSAVTTNAQRPPAAPAAKPAAPRTESRPVATARAPARPAPAPTPTPARSSTRNAQPDALCATRTQFAYLYCMQEQCARAIYRNNAQCAALRRSGDVR